MFGALALKPEDIGRTDDSLTAAGEQYLRLCRRLPTEIACQAGQQETLLRHPMGPERRTQRQRMARKRAMPTTAGRS